MAKVGYVMNYAGYRANTDKEWMKRSGCNEIMEEQQDYELRTEWNKLTWPTKQGGWTGRSQVEPRSPWDTAAFVSPWILPSEGNPSYFNPWPHRFRQRAFSGDTDVGYTQCRGIAAQRSIWYPQVLRCSPQSEKPHENIVPGGLQPHRAERVRGEYV